MFTRFKICCISSIEEAQLAIHYGASALGLVGEMPSGPGVIGDDLIREIAAMVPPAVSTFLLSSATSAKQIIAHQQRVQTGVIQLVDIPEEGAHKTIKQALPMVRLVQVIHVLNEQSAEEALRLAPLVDALLLDSGNPNLERKELGGTGRVHNWDLSRQIVERSPKPVLLAGGLNPENAALAINTVHPFALDICSGVRTDGKLNEEKLANFVKAVRSTNHV